MIDVQDLRFSYPGGRGEALHGLTFDVRPGEIFGFLGPSGAGKSTTQKILTGLLSGYSGSLDVFGRPLAELGRAYYERIGVVFEVPNLYAKLTGRENLDFFASLYRGPTAEADTLLAMVGLSDAADERVANYSKGMRMRLNFCRSLLREPELLFLDEPTSGQDPDNANRLKGIIRARRDQGSTVFLSTHDMAVAAELCDRVAFLIGGQIALVDNPRDLMVRYGKRQVRVEFHRDGDIAQQIFPLDGLGDNPQFLALLRTASVETIHTMDATLEEVFLLVTGRTLQ